MNQDFRPGTDAHRKPIWLTLPMILHPPIPAGADFRKGTARRDLVAGKARWSLFIAIRKIFPPKTAIVLACALDTG